MKRLIPAGHGFEFICFLLETRWGIPTFCFLSGTIIAWFLKGGWITFILGGIFAPIIVLISSTVLMYSISQMDAGGYSNWDEFIEVKDETLKKQYYKKKIPVDIMYEAYIREDIDFKKDVYEVMMRRNELFSFNFTFHNSLRFFTTTLLGKQVWNHSQNMDKNEVKPVYDRGNDFYNWFLGESMVYTSGLFNKEEEKLETAQVRKMDMICKSVHMKEGGTHLDIGCGWGTLLRHATTEYGAKSFGVTLAQNQVQYHQEVCKKDGVNLNECKSAVMDYRNIPTTSKYNSISCVEMAEHVGIKNFQNFLLHVGDLLADDGLFYLQIAGLRRTWQYEDLVWGIFMGKYIFPAADASCPLGWVTTQLERAGFEVHRVENTGVHYSLTIKKWYDNWISNKEKVIEKYGQYWFRMWSMFLAWSSIIASQGSSTVFMITCNKNNKNDARSIHDGKEKNLFSRMDTFVGEDLIATQQ